MPPVEQCAPAEIEAAQLARGFIDARQKLLPGDTLRDFWQIVALHYARNLDGDRQSVAINSMSPTFSTQREASIEGQP